MRKVFAVYGFRQNCRAKLTFNIDDPISSSLTCAVHDKRRTVWAKGFMDFGLQVYVAQTVPNCVWSRYAKMCDAVIGPL